MVQSLLSTYLGVTIQKPTSRLRWIPFTHSTFLLNNLYGSHYSWRYWCNSKQNKWKALPLSSHWVGKADDNLNKLCHIRWTSVMCTKHSKKNDWEFWEWRVSFEMLTFNQNLKRLRGESCRYVRKEHCRGKCKCKRPEVGKCWIFLGILRRSVCN